MHLLPQITVLDLDCPCWKHERGAQQEKGNSILRQRINFLLVSSMLADGSHHETLIVLNHAPLLISGRAKSTR